MSATDTDLAPTADSSLRPKPKRADARRNYEKVLAAARAAFTEKGADTSLEEIARRAEVGIGTLYRNFPNRQALLEAVYVEEVEQLSRSTQEIDRSDPWLAFEEWMHRFVAYFGTKHALAHEMLTYTDLSNPVFGQCKALLRGAGGPLLEAAQEAGVVRADTDLTEVMALVGALTKVQGADVSHLLDIALDGLRVKP